MIQRLTITLLGLLLAIQVLTLIARRDTAAPDDYTTPERPEPSRLLSGSSLPQDLTMQIRAIAQGECTTVVFASPTCPGSAILAEAWDYGLGESVWVFEGDAEVVETFRRDHSISDRSSLHLGSMMTLSDLGIFATPTWGFLDGAGVVHAVRVSSRQPLPSEKPDACS